MRTPLVLRIWRGCHLEDSAYDMAFRSGSVGSEKHHLSLPGRPDQTGHRDLEFQRPQDH